MTKYVVDVNQSSRDFRLKQILTLISVALALVGGMVSGFLSTRAHQYEQNAVEVEVEGILKEQMQLRARVAQLESLLSEYETRLQSLSSVSEASKIGARVKNLDSNLMEFKSQISKIEGVVLGNPLKALELPLLKKDLEGMEKTFRSDINSIRNEIDRTYDLGKWFLGLMVTMALSLVVLATSNLLKGSDSKEVIKPLDGDT